MRITEEEQELKIKELCDDTFLEKLAEVARLTGWSNDYIEICSFVEECFDHANKAKPDLQPHEIIYDQTT